MTCHFDRNTDDVVIKLMSPILKSENTPDENNILVTNSVSSSDVNISIDEDLKDHNTLSPSNLNSPVGTKILFPDPDFENAFEQSRGNKKFIS
jgi:hypothetical protein